MRVSVRVRSLHAPPIPAPQDNSDLTFCLLRQLFLIGTCA